MKTKFLILTILLSLLSIGCSNEAEFSEMTSTPKENMETNKSNFDVKNEEIDNVISSVFSSKSRSSQEQPYQTSVLYGSNGKPLIYIVNFANKNGFILISATKKHYPVLAHSFHGNYIVDDFNKPLALLEWEADMVESIELAENLSDSIDTRWNAFIEYEQISETPYATASSRANMNQIDRMIADSLASWRSKGYQVSSIDSYTPRDDYEEYYIEDMRNNMYPMAVDNWKDYVFVVRYNNSQVTEIKDLLGSKWSQSNHFNDMCPLYDGVNRSVVGCGPIAAGQIMRYHKKPQHLAWNNMPLTYATTTTASFLYELGTKAKATYGSQTGTTEPNIKSAIESYGYKCKLDNYNRNTAQQNIKNKRPVFMSGYDGKSGHAWVVSGIYNSTSEDVTIIYHPVSNVAMFPAITHRDNTAYIYANYCNWGWGGSYDGYYGMDRYTPNGYNFSSNQKMIYDIYY